MLQRHAKKHWQQGLRVRFKRAMAACYIAYYCIIGLRPKKG